MVEGSDPGTGTVTIDFHGEMDKDNPVKPKEETISAAFSPDGSCVATGSWQGAVTIWDARTGKSLRSWTRTGDGRKKIQAIEYTPDGTRLLLVYSDGKQDEVAVWHASDGKEVVRWSGFSGVRLARFSPSGRGVLIVPGSFAGLPTGLQAVSPAGNDESRQRQEKWYPGANGELAFAKPEVRTVYLRNVESGDDVALFKGHEENVTSAQFNADGSQVVTAAEDGTVRVWNSGDRRQYGTVLSGHAIAVAEAAFSPDGRSVMTTCGDRSLRIWNAETGTLLQTLKDGLGLNADAENHIFGAVRHAEFNFDGSRLLTVSEDSFVVDDAGHPLDKLSTGESVAFAPVRVWDVASGKKLVSLSGFAAGVSTAALSPDGRRIVTLTDNRFKDVKLDAKNQPKEWGDSGGGPVITKADPAGKPIRYYQDAAVRVWDADSGRQIAALSESECLGACGAAWSPDEKLLFVAGILADNRVHLQIWNAATLKPMQELPTGQSDVSWFSASRHSVATAAPLAIADRPGRKARHDLGFGGREACRASRPSGPSQRGGLQSGWKVGGDRLE